MLNIISKLLGGFFKKPLKIGIIVYEYPLGKAIAGGSYMHSYYLSRNLALLGCEVHVFSSGEKDRIVREKIGNGILIVHVIKADVNMATKNLPVTKRLNWYAFETRVLNQIMWENSKRWFDIIHSQGWSSTAFMLKHFSNMNWVHTFHSLNKGMFRYRSKEEKKFMKVQDWLINTASDADKIITVSEKSRQAVIKEFKGIAKKTIVIPNGVDMDVFKPIIKSPATVFVVGRFSKEKGIFLLPEIIDKVLKKDRKYKFILIAPVGKEVERDEDLLEAKNRLDLLLEKYSKRFTWIQTPLNSKELYEIHKKAGVFLQPSLYENAPLTILEAMATGRAIVATDVGGISEQLNKTGLLAKPDSKDLANKIIKLLGNIKLRKKYGKMAIERAKKEYSWKYVAERTLKAYHDVIEERENTEDEK